MKATIIGSKKEGFLSTVGLELENGLLLETIDLCWCGLNKKRETLKQFEEFLRSSNIELTNPELLQKVIKDDLD